MELDFDSAVTNNALNFQEYLDGGMPEVEAALHERWANQRPIKIIHINNELRTQGLINKLDLLESFDDFDITSLDEETMIELWSILLERDQVDSTIKKAVNAHFKALGLPAPQYATVEGLKKRLLCDKFWKRAISKARNRQYEHRRIIKGDVAAHKQVYSSDSAVKQVAKRRIQNAKAMAELYAVSDEGDVVNMASIIEHSIANPSVRHAELMVKMRGFEDYARESCDVNMFYTLTAPSKYHRYSKDVFNVRYEKGMSPRQAQRYLCKIWARVRAKLARDGIKLYGVRVCEPHKDGCPHFHFSVFMKPEQVEAVNAAFRHYALEEDGHEYGADEHRFKIEAVRTASAYIVKYISKNLGLSINDPDFDHVTYGQRVSTWASLWGVRQFQVIGGAPSGIWRELRKQRVPVADETLEEVRHAADTGDWAAYLNAMGGATVKRDELPLTLMKSTTNATGEALVNRYDEAVSVVVGVCSATANLVTRLKSWVIVSGDSPIFKPAEASNTISEKPISTRPRVNNCTLLSSGQMLTHPNFATREAPSLDLHEAHVQQYKAALKSKIVRNFQKALDKKMDKYCVSHVEAFKKYQKYLEDINRRQYAHVSAYRKHLKRNAALEVLTNDPTYGCDSVAA